MPQWNVLIADAIAESGVQALKARAEVTEDTAITPEELLAEIHLYDAVVVRSRTKITQEVIQAGERLKLIGRAGVGVDNIDLAAAKAKGVRVVNTPTATSQAVAELTLGLMLSLVRGIPRGDAGMKAGQWEKKALRGAELAGKTLGLIGVGNIGARVSRLAQAFGMRVVGYDPPLPEEVIRQSRTEPVSLEELYALADVISIHVPLIPETRGMIEAEALAKMKAGVYLVCTARGGIIDEGALLAGLNSGQVAGAALDVFAAEPPGASELVTHPNLVATPHIGAQTEEAQVRAAEQVVEELIRGLEGRPLRWQVV